jgi:Na+/serine symporter
MAKNGEKLLFIPHKSLLNSNKQPHSTPPPNLSSILRFLLMNLEKKPIRERLEGFAKETS